MKNRPKPQTETGIVLSRKQDKTAIIIIKKLREAPFYKKRILRSRKVYAHDAKNSVQAGDKVLLVETKPLSKLKRWRVVKILERPKISQDIKLIIDEVEKPAENTNIEPKE